MVKTNQEIIKEAAKIGKEAVRDAKVDGTINDIFTEDEKKKFNDSRVKDSNVEEFAKLLLDIKTAMTITDKIDTNLQTTLRTKIISIVPYSGSVEEILKPELVLAWKTLTDLAKYISPTLLTKDQINTKISEFDMKIIELQASSTSEENSAKKTFIQGEIDRLKALLKTAKENSGDSDKVAKVLRGDENIEITFGGTKKKLSDISLTINDYSGSGLFDVDASGKFAPTKTETQSALVLINKANDYLNNLKNIQKKPNIWVTTLINSYGNRRVNCYQNISHSDEGITTTLRKVLRDMEENGLLTKLINDTDTISDKVAFKKDLDSVLKYTSFYHVYTGHAVWDLGELIQNHGINEKEKEVIFINWLKSSLQTQKIDDFPYILETDYLKIARIMKELFPIQNWRDSSDKTTYYQLKHGHKLFSGTDEYKFPKKLAGKLSVNGYFDIVPGTDPKYNGYTSIRDYITKTGNYKEQIEGPYYFDIEKDLPKDVIQAWWDSSAKHFDLDTLNFKPEVANDNNYAETAAEKYQFVHRYAKTMREILEKLGFGKLGQYDKYLLDIAENEVALVDGEDAKRQPTNYDFKKTEALGIKWDYYTALIVSGEVKTYNWLEALNNLALTAFTEHSLVADLERDIKSWEIALSQIFSNEVDIRLQIEEYRRQIELLKKLRDRDKPSDIPAWETDFNTIYARKSEIGRDGKWKRSEIKDMINALEAIKILMKDDPTFNAKYLKKQQELKDIEEKIKERVRIVDSEWDSVFLGVGDDLNKAIEKIKKRHKELKTKPLEYYRDIIVTLEPDIILEEREVNSLVAINAAIAGTPVPTPVPFTPELTKADLASYLGLIETDISDEALERWNKATGIKDNKYYKRDNVKDLINKITDKSKLADAVKLVDDTITETDANKLWKEIFTTKDLTTQIKVIKAYELNAKTNDEFKAILDAALIKNDGTTDEKLINWDDPAYGGEPSKDNKKPLIEYLYREEIGKAHEFKAKQDSPDNKDKDRKDKKPFYSWDTTSGKVIWISVSLVAVALVAGFIFWDNLKRWWNGPAEGEGDSSSPEEENK